MLFSSPFLPAAGRYPHEARFRRATAFDAASSCVSRWRQTAGQLPPNQEFRRPVPALLKGVRNGYEMGDAPLFISLCLIPESDGSSKH
jgi:hypothetical protein